MNMFDLALALLLALHTNAWFTDTVPPWSCTLQPDTPLNICLNPASSRSPLMDPNAGILIGHGFSGIVRVFPGIGSHPPLAVKTFVTQGDEESSEDYIATVLHEQQITNRLGSNDNIITVYDLVPDGQHWHQVMEYIPHQLQELVLAGTVTGALIDCMFRQIVDAVAYMHEQGIAHLDLKPSNIMMTNDGRIKVIDFGSAIISAQNSSNGTSLMTGELGALNYLAPEVLEGHPYDPRLADVWALGMMYVYMTLKVCPWQQARALDERYGVFIDDRSRLISLLPASARNMVGIMLSVEPEDRASMSKVKGFYFNVDTGPRCMTSDMVDGSEGKGP